jgi:hypothetical protein
LHIWITIWVNGILRVTVPTYKGTWMVYKPKRYKKQNHPQIPVPIGIIKT